MRIKQVYEQHYKKLLIIPFVLLALAIIQIGVQTAITGDFVNKGVSLRGGSTITIEQLPSLSEDKINSFLSSKFPKADFSVRTLQSGGRVAAYAIDSDAQEPEEIDALVSAVAKQFSLSKNQYNVEVMGSSLGESFFRQTIMSLLVAFF